MFLFIYFVFFWYISLSNRKANIFLYYSQKKIKEKRKQNLSLEVCQWKRVLSDYMYVWKSVGIFICLFLRPLSYFCLFFFYIYGLFIFCCYCCCLNVGLFLNDFLLVLMFALLAKGRECVSKCNGYNLNLAPFKSSSSSSSSTSSSIFVVCCYFLFFLISFFYFFIFIKSLSSYSSLCFNNISFIICLPLRRIVYVVSFDLPYRSWLPLFGLMILW